MIKYTVSAIKTILTPKGIKINRRYLTAEQELELSTNCKVTPKTLFNKNNEFSVLRYNANFIYLPKYYYLINGSNNVLEFHDYPKIPKINCSFKSEHTLRPQQKNIIDEVMPKLKQIKGGIISIPCGCGKTVTALFIATLLKARTLIIVNTTDLANQWKDQIHNFIQNATVKILSNKNYEEITDFTIGTFQMLLSDKNKLIFTRQYFTVNFKLVIFDECHHVAAQQFSTIADKANTKYVLGLSATPRRSDGLMKVVNWYLGPLLYSTKQRPENYIKKVEVLTYEISEDLPLMCYRFGKYTVNTNKTITTLSQDPKRNNLIIQALIKHAQDMNNVILVLSERRNHLKELMDKLNQVSPEISTGILYQKVDNQSINNDNIKQTKQIIFSTYQLSKEGMDVPRINTILFATPYNDIEQSVGRAMRNTTGTVTIIDILDLSSATWFQNKFYVRLKYYRHNDFKVSTDFDNYKPLFQD